MTQTSSLLDRCARLPLIVDDVEVTPLEQPAAAGGTRRSALARLLRQAKDGHCEEVTFQQADLLEGAPSGELFRGVAAALADLWAQLDERSGTDGWSVYGAQQAQPVASVGKSRRR